MNVGGFDWDIGNRVKCQKHGVSIAEIEALFAGDFFVADDLGHSMTEVRLKAFGTTSHDRKLLVIFTVRHKGEQTYIRPVSARYMHKKEAEYYEKEIANFKN